MRAAILDTDEDGDPEDGPVLGRPKIPDVNP